MVPLTVEEMWESAASNVDQLIENGGDHGLSLHFEVHAALGTESEHFFEQEAGRCLEDLVNRAEDKSSVAFALMLRQQDLILNVEMRDIVVKVDVFGNEEGRDHVAVDSCAKR